MTNKQVTLALAAFLDSRQALMLPAPSTAEIRSIAERFLASAYEDLGRAPEELDGDALRELLGVALPTRFEHDDALGAHVPVVLEAYFEHLEEVAVVAHAFEQKLALEPGLEAFASAVGEQRGPRRRSDKERAPFKHGASKTGRNDPCPCGSGKKFKHCHG